LGVLVYGYTTGVFSSRKLERATYDSVAFRFISGNEQRPIATSPVKAALPVPSMMVPPRMTMSCTGQRTPCKRPKLTTLPRIAI
jgi:hypothetical protein